MDSDLPVIHAVFNTAFEMGFRATCCPLVPNPAALPEWTAPWLLSEKTASLISSSAPSSAPKPPWWGFLYLSLQKAGGFLKSLVFQWAYLSRVSFSVRLVSTSRLRTMSYWFLCFLWPSKDWPASTYYSKCDPWTLNIGIVYKFIWKRKWLPTPVFLPGESHGWVSLACYSPWGHKELDTTEWLTHRHTQTHTHTHTEFHWMKIIRPYPSWLPWGGCCIYLPRRFTWKPPLGTADAINASLTLCSIS